MLGGDEKIGLARPDRQVERPDETAGVKRLATGQFIAHRDALAGACRGQHEVHIREDDALAEFDQTRPAALNQRLQSSSSSRCSKIAPSTSDGSLKPPI